MQGELGYELIATFEQNPRLGPLEFKDQLSEEAFTVYDHPKVLIFAKQADFDPTIVNAKLGNVDVSRVRNLPPNEIGSVSPDLLLTDEQLELQQSGGTWSELFSPRQSHQPLPATGSYCMVADNYGSRPAGISAGPDRFSRPTAMEAIRSASWSRCCLSPGLAGWLGASGFDTRRAR